MFSTNKTAKYLQRLPLFDKTNNCFIVHCFGVLEAIIFLRLRISDKCTVWLNAAPENIVI